MRSNPLIYISAALLILNVALLAWVARDSKARDMDNNVLWMVVVMFTGLVGAILYIYSRPKGSLSRCPQCNNKRLPTSAKCPYCERP